MAKEYPRIIFMGTPEFAVVSLKKLLEHSYNVVAVITAPDKPSGRGRKIQMPEVKKYALEKNLLVLQPPKLKAPEFNQQLRELKPDLQIVVAFRMLPESVWKLPELGTINLHASLLPQYRGAAPINHAVMNGENKTGITTFFIREEIDTGNILLQKEIDIQPDHTAGDVHDILMENGANLVIKTVDGIVNNTITPKKQEELFAPNDKLKLASKIFKEDCKIDWNKNAEEINNKIRGLSPYPAAFSELVDSKGNASVLKIYRAHTEKNTPKSSPGTIVSDDKTFFKIATSDGFILPTEVQLSGKRKMKTDEFLRGFKGIAEYQCT